MAQSRPHCSSLKCLQGAIAGTFQLRLGCSGHKSQQLFHKTYKGMWVPFAPQVELRQWAPLWLAL